MKKIALILVVLMVATLLAGCGGEKTTIKTDNGTMTIDEDQNKLEFKTEDGKSEFAVSETEGESVSLPDGYPKDLVPIMDGAIITIANKTDQQGKVSYWVTLTTDKTPKEAYEFYANALKDLDELNKMESTEMSTISGIKGNDKVDLIIITEENDGKNKTLINIAIGSL